jgi:hypothetical protein
MLHSRRQKPKSLKRVGDNYNLCKMKKLDNFHDCEEMANSELITINGGESPAHWLAYAIGRAARFINDALESQN